MPKLNGVQLETAIIKRHGQENVPLKKFLLNVSCRCFRHCVEDITEALWGTWVSSCTSSNLYQKAYEHIEKWRSRPLTDEYSYVYVDGVYLKRS